MSDFIPNSFQTPNDYVDRFMHLLTPEEYKVLSYTVRRIFGFHKRQDRISISQYMRGTRDKEGNPLDFGTGLARPTIIRALDALEKFGLQVKVEENDVRVNEGACYALQLDPKKVNVAGLEDRAEQARSKGRDRTQNARDVTPRHQRPGKSDLLPLSDPLVSPTYHPPVSGIDRDQSVPLTEPGKSDLPPPVSPTYSQNTEGNPGEIQEKHTHTVARPPATGNGNGKVCVCDTPHGSKICDAERIRLASTMPTVREPDKYAMTLHARRGTYDIAFLRHQRTLKKRQTGPTTPERDISACPDCHGQNGGLYYPDPTDKKKGMVKCFHPHLDEELEKLEREVEEMKMNL